MIETSWKRKPKNESATVPTAATAFPPDCGQLNCISFGQIIEPSAASPTRSWDDLLYQEIAKQASVEGEKIEKILPHIRYKSRRITVVDPNHLNNLVVVLVPKQCGIGAVYIDKRDGCAVCPFCMTYKGDINITTLTADHPQRLTYDDHVNGGCPSIPRSRSTLETRCKYHHMFYFHISCCFFCMAI
jgi:hypothetical protein